MRPKRIQRQSCAPDGALYVGRGTPWENPFSLKFGLAWHPEARHRRVSEAEAREFTVDLYRQWMTGTLPQGWTNKKPPCLLSEISSLNLSCWCDVGAACHADVLLELANAQGGVHAKAGGFIAR